MPQDRERIEAYLTRLYGYAFSLARDRAEAEDLVQTCAMKALGARNVPADENAYRSWLFRILRNQFIDGVRHSKRANNLFADTPPEDDEILEYWQGDERLIDEVNVRLAFGKLDVRQREILSLVDIAGLSYRESAAVLDIPEGTVMSRISRARSRLLEIIEESNVRSMAPKRRRGGK
jgi:RNA polymerase sigma-70 factor (ECF subfamily)